MPARFITWIIILFSLTVGAVLWWRLQGENQGQAAETMNVTVPGPTSSILVGHWTLDGNDVVWGDTTSEIKDVSGYAKHGNSSNLAAGSATVGKIGQGLVFNGTNDSVSLGNVYNGVKTVAFWVKPNSTTQPFIDLNGTATVDINAGTVRGNNFATPTVYVDGVATATFPDTGWHHIAITTATGINASAAYLGLISSTYFGGMLDDIRFYSTELSATQVADLYRSSGAKQTINFGMEGTLTDGLVGHWTMDGNDVIWGDTSSEVKDRSGNGNDGDAVGLTASSAVIGKLGQALSFNGSHIYVGSIGTLASSLSVAFWMKPSALIDNHTVIDWGNDSYVKVYGYGYDRLQCELDSGYGLIESAESSIEAETWYHVAYTSDSGGQKLFIDGVLIGSTATPHTSITTDVTIGDSYWGSKAFTGIIDDVRIYNRALSTSEVYALYKMSK